MANARKPTSSRCRKLNGNGGQTYINQTIGMDPVFWIVSGKAGDVWKAGAGAGGPGLGDTGGGTLIVLGLVYIW